MQLHSLFPAQAQPDAYPVDSVYEIECILDKGYHRVAGIRRSGEGDGPEDDGRQVDKGP